MTSSTHPGDPTRHRAGPTARALFRAGLGLAGLGLTGGVSAGEYLARHEYGALHEPVGAVLHGAGQSEELAFAHYTQAVGAPRLPCLTMFYTRANRTVEDQRQRMESLARHLAALPAEVGLQLGLAFSQNGVSHASAVTAGDHDASLRVLAEGLAALNRPVLVRIGYEANGFWNGYSPSNYPAAFRHIAGILRAEAANVATVWCTHPVDSLSRMLQFHPGDEWVDWWSIDLFEPGFLSSRNTADFLAEAHRRGRPVLIGESTPREVGVHAADAWDRWFEPYFRLIRQNPGIKGFCYINRQWDNFSSYSGWRDSRLEANRAVADLYRQEMDSPLYRHAPPHASRRVFPLAPRQDGTAGTTSADGLGPELRAAGTASGQRRWMLVEFELPGITEETEAVLWMLTDNPTSARVPLHVHAVEGGPWSEASLAAGSTPGPAGEALGTGESGSVNNLRWAAVTVTPAVQAAGQQGTRRLTLAVTVPDDTVAVVRAWSREGLAATAPVTREGLELLVTTSPADPGEDEGYRAWLARHWALDPAFADPGQTLANDGYPNLLKYAVGRSPWEPLPRLLEAAAADPGAWRLRRPASRQIPFEVELLLQESADLGTWAPVDSGAHPGEVEEGADGRWLGYPMGVAPGGSRFHRLTIRQLAPPVP